jgi:hypothetical protein
MNGNGSQVLQFPSWSDEPAQTFLVYQVFVTEARPRGLG